MTNPPPSDAERRRQRDFEDQQNEAAGRQTGRMDRFLIGESARGTRATSKSQEKAQRFYNRLQQLLNDPAYCQHYDRILHLLDQAQAKLDTAITQSAAAMERLETIVEDLEDSAAKMADGTAVFRAADGSVYTADGRKLSLDEVRDIEFSPDAPSWERYRYTKEALTKARTRMDKLDGIQTEVITPARDRMTNPDSPASRDDLDEIEGDLTRAIEEIDVATKAAPSFGQAAHGHDEHAAIDPELMIDLPAP